MKNLLTKKQRHLVYKKLLQVVCDDPEIRHGMCYYLLKMDYSEISLPEFFMDNRFQRMIQLPELLKHKPNEFFIFYWAPLTDEGWKTRIKWIEQAIRDTK